MRDAGRADERLVGCVEQNEGFPVVGPVHPLLELLLRRHRPRRVVGVAQIDDIRIPGGFGAGDETVRGVAGQIDKPRIASALVRARPAGHDVRVHIDGVDGVAHRYLDVLVEKFLDVAAIALGAVRDENLVRGDIHSARGEVDGGDLLAQEGVALLGPVAVERRARAFVVHGFAHGRENGRSERFRHVADAQADDLGVRMRRLVRIHAVRDFRKEIAGLDFLVVFVDVQHGRHSFRN